MLRWLQPHLVCNATPLSEDTAYDTAHETLYDTDLCMVWVILMPVD